MLQVQHHCLQHRKVSVTKKLFADVRLIILLFEARTNIWAPSKDIAHSFCACAK